MTAIEVQPTAPSSSSSRRFWVWRPPGLAFYASTLFVVFLGLASVSLPSFLGPAVGQVLWLTMAGIWLVRLAGAGIAERLRFGMLEWVRWLVVPPVFAAAYLVASTTIPFDVRLSLSRAGMDQAAAEIMAGGSTDRDSIGLYAVSHVERIRNGVRFLVSGGGFIDQWGYAYSRGAGPTEDDGGLSSYQHLDGDWWIWTFRFG
jgi:hypothetical protein